MVLQHAATGAPRVRWSTGEPCILQAVPARAGGLKLLMNAFSGVLGACECRFFGPALVSAATLRGKG